MQPLMMSMMNDDWERFTSYHIPVMLPFGRLGRNVYRTYKNPIRVGEEMMGVPVIAAQRKLREMREKEKVAPRPFDLDAHAPRPQTQADRETGDQSEISETIF
jgi:hypothetical protein